MNSSAKNASGDTPRAAQSEEPASAYVADAIPSGIEQVKFLKDPVTDQLVRITMELGAALWVERRRSRILEQALVASGALAADALEQWVDEPDIAAAERKELDSWMRRIYGGLAETRPVAEEEES